MKTKYKAAETSKGTGEDPTLRRKKFLERVAKYVIQPKRYALPKLTVLTDRGAYKVFNEHILYDKDLSSFEIRVLLCIGCCSYEPIEFSDLEPLLNDRDGPLALPELQSDDFSPDEMLENILRDLARRGYVWLK